MKALACVLAAAGLIAGGGPAAAKSRDSEALQILEAAKLDKGVKDGKPPATNPGAGDAAFDVAIAGAAASGSIGGGGLPGLGKGGTIGLSLLSAMANSLVNSPVEINKFITFVPRAAARDKHEAAAWARDVVARAIRSGVESAGYSVAMGERAATVYAEDRRRILAFGGPYFRMVGEGCPVERGCEVTAVSWSDHSLAKPIVRKGSGPAFAGKQDAWIVIFNSGIGFVPPPAHWRLETCGINAETQALIRKITGYLPPQSYFLKGTYASTCRQPRVPRLINSEGSRFLIKGTAAMPTAEADRLLAQ